MAVHISAKYRRIGLQRPGHPRPGPQGGFTLIEVLVTLLLATLIISTVPPMLTGTISSTETRAAARQLAAGLRHARSQAIATQQETALMLDLEQRRFRTTSGRHDIRLAEDLDLTLTTTDSEVAGPDQGNIRFFPDGSSTGGRIEVADQKHRYTLDVDWLTGRIELHD